MHIFDFLPTKELGLVGFVCRHWEVSTSINIAPLLTKISPSHRMKCCGGFGLSLHLALPSFYHAIGEVLTREVHIQIINVIL